MQSMEKSTQHPSPPAGTRSVVGVTSSKKMVVIPEGLKPGLESTWGLRLDSDVSHTRSAQICEGALQMAGQAAHSMRVCTLTVRAVHPHVHTHTHTHTQTHTNTHTCTPPHTHTHTSQGQELDLQRFGEMVQSAANTMQGGVGCAVLVDCSASDSVPDMVCVRLCVHACARLRRRVHVCVSVCAVRGEGGREGGHDAAWALAVVAALIQHWAGSTSVSSVNAFLHTVSSLAIPAVHGLDPCGAAHCDAHQDVHTT